MKLESLFKLPFFATTCLAMACAGGAGKSSSGQTGAASGAVPASPVGQSVQKTLRVGSEITFRDAYILLSRVEENEHQNKLDDSVDVSVRTGGGTQKVTIQETETARVGDFEIKANDVTPSTMEGESRAKLEIRFHPGE